MTVTDGNKAPEPLSQITTVRSICTHSVSPKVPATGAFDQPVADMVIFSSTFLENEIRSENLHFLGFVFNEDTDTPFAVVLNEEGVPMVLWDFEGDTNFNMAELHYNKSATSREWAAITAKGLLKRAGMEPMLAELLEVLKGTGVQVLGFDENGPFSL